MPEYTFDGLSPMFFPETRDSAGVLLGQVDPGDICTLDEAPDSLLWHETTDEERIAAAEAPGWHEHPGTGEPPHVIEGAADGTMSPPFGSDAGEDTGTGQEGTAPDPGPGTGEHSAF